MDFLTVVMTRVSINFKLKTLDTEPTFFILFLS